MTKYIIKIWLPHLGDRFAIVKAQNEEQAEEKIKIFVETEINKSDIVLLE